MYIMRSSVLPLHGRFVAPEWLDPYHRHPCASLAALKLAQKMPGLDRDAG
jgi:hypothetical protein